MRTTTEDIDQSIRLLEELKHNLKEIEKAKTYTLLQLQESIKDRWGFPRYCLTVRRNVRIYFLNKYANTINRILLGQNDGIPLSVNLLAAKLRGMD